MGRNFSLSSYPRWIRFISGFIVGVMLAILLSQVQIATAIAQNSKQNDKSSGATCAIMPTSLTNEEKDYAKAAWQYFAKNYQPATGFVNATGGYPSATLWDIGNYLVALNTARSLDLVPQKEFDDKLNKFLTSLGSLKLFEDSLPNKVYNTATLAMVDYGNNPSARGIGWSALDIGRILAAFHIIRTCHPQYNDWMKGILARWQLTRSLKDDQLYGATVTGDGSTMLVQEGRLGYEEYAVRGYELWGFKADKAKSFDPFKFVDIYGVQIPVDTRDYQTTNANNYVVSESYILDGIEFGWESELADYANRVLEVQKRRFEQTGQLTAVTEDNLDAPPYFIYNTVYSNGVDFAAITDENKPIPQFRSISTKAAFGWRYLYPTNDYAKKIFDAVKGLRSEKDEGFYAGLYESSKIPNKSLTGNTNGLILEILYYKARGNRPIIDRAGVVTTTAASNTSAPIASTPTTSSSPTANTNTAPSSQSSSTSTKPTAIAKAVAVPPPISPVTEESSPCPKLNQPLSVSDRRYAQAAWQYFRTNSPASGLTNDRRDFKGVTLWGLGDYLIALRAAKALDIITWSEFDQRVRQLIGTVRQLPLVGGELPSRAYDPASLQPVDYGGNSAINGTGWSAADIGRFLSALYSLKSCHPEYTDAVDRTLLDWSYLRVVRDRILLNGIVTKDGSGRNLSRVTPESRLGYSEYAARAFQLWGFDVDRSVVGNQYAKANVEGFEIPIRRMDAPKSSELEVTVSEPFLMYGLDFGLDPQMRALTEPIIKAQAERYRRTKLLTAANTSAINTPPYILHSSIVGNGQGWANLDDQGQSAKGDRIVSTGTAFAMYALFPNEPYTRELWQAVTDLYNPQLGFYEGFYENSGNRENNQTASTNSLILQSILYRATDQQPLIRPTSANSAWWQAIASEDLSRGLPSNKAPTAKFITNGADSYWVSANSNTITSEKTPNLTADIPLIIDRTQPTKLRPVTPESKQPFKLPVVIPIKPIASPEPKQPPIAISPKPQVPVVNPSTPQPQPIAPISQISLSETDAIAAKLAWKYFENNFNPQTGMVNAVDRYAWTTLWDQGSALLGLHSAQQLGIISPEVFQQRLTALLNTLEKLPLPKHGLPNKAYSTTNAAMYQLDNTPDPDGISGWSTLDTARFLGAMHVIRVNHPAYRDRINNIVNRWQLTKLVKDGWLYGGHPDSSDRFQYLQEGRLGYEQYAAHSLKLWGIEAANALNNPPIQTVKVDGIDLEVDRRDLQNSGASNHLTNDPYVLWGLEIGWNDMGKRQAETLYQLQKQRFERTQIVTSINEDSINRSPYFLYYSAYVNGQPWQAIDSRGKAYPELKFVSTKAAFGWSVLQSDEYASKLRDTMNSVADRDRGYLSGKYENPNLGVNNVMDVNTNGIVLESLLYKARGNVPLLSSSNAVQALPVKLANQPSNPIAQKPEPVLPKDSINPRPPLLLGLYTSGYIGEQSTIDRELKPVDQWTGKKHAIAGIFMDIQDENPDYNIGRRLELLRENGYTAFINLKSTRTAAEIARGDLDKDLRRVAKAVADWTGKGEGRMMFIAPMQEMNINAETYSLDPINFKIAYQRLQQIFAEFSIPAKSVLWVFAPNGFSPAREHDFENYYPKDAQVDIVGFSGYNWGYCPNPINQRKLWDSPELAYAPYISRMQKLAPNKPIFITQTASSSYVRPQTQDQNAKDEWLSNTFKYFANTQAVQAVIYFNIQKECDWALNMQNPNGKYQESIADPKFGYVEPRNMQQLFNAPIKF